MSVVGFDVGNNTCIIAAARPTSGIEALLNEESKREIPASISFSEKQRLIGSSSSPLLYPSSTFSQIKQLVLAHPKYRHRLSYLNRKITLNPTYLLAMLLSHLKIIAERSLKAPVSDCVLSLPSYASDLARRSYLNAAHIAGLNPLLFIHDTTATALLYGIYKTDYPNDKVHVVFIDIGHSDTQVSVVAFEPSGMHVLSHASDPLLGGRNFDQILFKHFVEQFKDRYKIDVSSNAKACIRLRAACEKVKKVLSANAGAPISIDCLMNDKDVKGFIKREEFEKLASGLLKRVLAPCKKALEDAGVGIDTLHSVELVGSGSRIPAIVRILTEFFGKEPCRTLNTSESVARGCALQCAKQSPLFKVRRYEVHDAMAYSVGFALEGNEVCTISSDAIFPKGHSFPNLKVLSFDRSSTFRLEAFYVDDNGVPLSATAKLSSFLVGPFQTKNPGGNPKVKVRIHLNPYGIVVVGSVLLIEDDTKDTDSSEASCSNSSNTEAAKAVESEISEESEPTLLCTTTEKPSKSLHLPVTGTAFGGMTQTGFSETLELEKQLADQDKLVEQTKEKKNALEAYVYDVRNKLFERYQSFATESEREGISIGLQETEEWLYSEGDDETETVYSQFLEDLKELADPVIIRFEEEAARAQATRKLLQTIVDNRMAVATIATFERDTVLSECNKAEQWLRDKKQQQDSLPKSTDPVLWSHEIHKTTEELDKSCKQALKLLAPTSVSESHPKPSTDTKPPADTKTN